MTDSTAALLAAWREPDPQRKVAQVAALPELEAIPTRVQLDPEPGRPQRPELVHPARVPRRSLGRQAGRVALLHAIAHIEFNAINLALDAALRFGPEMPLEFAQDWLSVARDEARHFQMLQQRLEAMGATYGQCPAHNGLWEAAEKTATDVLARMALVPRVLEARGLDVTPGMIARLQGVGATEDVAVLEIILEEEVRHVAIGTHWYRWLCARRDLEPVATFQRLCDELMPGRHTGGPFNHAARAQAGFVPEEYLSPVEADPPH